MVDRVVYLQAKSLVGCGPLWGGDDGDPTPLACDNIIITYIKINSTFAHNDSIIFQFLPQFSHVGCRQGCVTLLKIQVYLKTLMTFFCTANYTAVQNWNQIRSFHAWHTYQLLVEIKHWIVWDLICIPILCIFIVTYHKPNYNFC